MMSNLIKMPGIKELPKSAPRAVRSVMDTLLITPAGIERWKKPSFQRELKLTPKVQALVETMKADGGVVPGIITLGKLDGETYLIDGQHRIEAFKLSGLTEGVADVRICHFETVGEMGEEFTQLNSSLVRMTSDDVLRGLEGINVHLQQLRRKCPFVGYDNIRRNTGSTRVLSMTTAIRTWFGSSSWIPSAGPPSVEAVKLLDDAETARLITALTIFFEAWGKAPENFRLWGTLNLSLVYWFWRRLVLKEGLPARRGGIPTVTLNAGEFRQCLMSLSANGRYIEWLSGRALRERDRSACYSHIKTIFAGRLGGMGFGRPLLPAPEWGGR